MAQANGVITMAGGPGAVSAALQSTPIEAAHARLVPDTMGAEPIADCDVRTNFAVDCFVARPC